MVILVVVLYVTLLVTFYLSLHKPKVSQYIWMYNQQVTYELT